MKCWECEHFKIKYEPIGKISTGMWDFGRAVCEKHDLFVDFPDHRKLKKLVCIENKGETSNEAADHGRNASGEGMV